MRWIEVNGHFWAKRKLFLEAKQQIKNWHDRKQVSYRLSRKYLFTFKRIQLSAFITHALDSQTVHWSSCYRISQLSNIHWAKAKIISTVKKWYSYVRLKLDRKSFDCTKRRWQKSSHGYNASDNDERERQRQSWIITNFFIHIRVLKCLKLNNYNVETNKKNV